MAQDILLGKMRYEVEVTGENATINIQKLNVNLGKMRDHVKNNEVGLGHFLTKAKLGWGALGVTVGAVIGQISKGSSLLSSIGSAPAKLLESVGQAIDIAFPNAMANFHRWLAETQAGIINWGTELGRADDKVRFITKSLAELTGKTFVASVRIAVTEGPNVPGQAVGAVRSGVSGIIEGVTGSEAAGTVGGSAVAPGLTYWLARRAAGAGGWIEAAGTRVGAAPELLGVRGALTRGAAWGVGMLGKGALLAGVGEMQGGVSHYSDYYPGDPYENPEAYRRYSEEFNRARSSGASFDEAVARAQHHVTINNYFTGSPNPDTWNWEMQNRFGVQPGSSPYGGVLP